MEQTKRYIKARGNTIAHPTMLIALDEKDFPIANVAVTKAVFGKMKENQFIENDNRPGPTTDQ
jgi:hypothetical protein